jgi:hypothetical protein
MSNAIQKLEKDQWSEHCDYFWTGHFYQHTTNQTNKINRGKKRKKTDKKLYKIIFLLPFRCRALCRLSWGCSRSRWRAERVGSTAGCWKCSKQGTSEQSGTW